MMSYMEEPEMTSYMEIWEMTRYTEMPEMTGLMEEMEMTSMYSGEIQEQTVYLTHPETIRSVLKKESRQKT